MQLRSRNKAKLVDDSANDVQEITANANSDEENEVVLDDVEEIEINNVISDNKTASIEECSVEESESDDAALDNVEEINVSDNKTAYIDEYGTKETESDDDAPEDITLKESKRVVQEAWEQQVKSALLLKEQKKKLVKEREKQNKLQHSKKSNAIKSSLPEKLDAELLELAEEEEAKKTMGKDVLKTQMVIPNRKTYFSDSDHDSDIEDTTEENKIQACYIGEVKKGIDKSVQHFLQNHFYGNRLQREVTKGNKKKRKQGNKCDISWIKKRNLTS